MIRKTGMSKRPLRKAAALLLSVLLLLGLAGCGERGEESTADSPARWQKTVTVGTDGPVKTFDPQKISNAAHDTVLQLIYNTLLSRNGETGEFEPELALSWQWTDSSCTALQVTLRQNVTFQNGSQLTAADVAFTLDRATGSNVKNSYDHTDITGDYSLTICLKGSNPDFLWQLSSMTTAIVSREALTADESAVCGTGAWQLLAAETRAGDTVTLVRNENYWGELPQTEKLVLRYISNDSARLVALENHEIDCLVTLAYTEIEAARANQDLVTEIYVGTGLNYLAFNLTSSAGSSEKLRQAVAWAIDREALIDAAGDPAGMAAASLFARGASAYTEAFEDAYSYAPEKARQLVEELTAETGEEPCLKLMVNTSIQSYKTMAEVLQEQLRQVGIRLTLEEVDASGLTAATKYGKATHEALLYTIYLNPFNSDVARLLTPGVSTNKASLEDAAVQELLARGLEAEEGEARDALYRQVQALVNEHCWYIPLFYGSGSLCYRSGTEGVKAADNARHDFTYIRVREQ